MNGFFSFIFSSFFLFWNEFLNASVFNKAMITFNPIQFNFMRYGYTFHWNEISFKSF